MKWMFYESESETRAKVVLVYHQQPTSEVIQEVGLSVMEVTNYTDPEQQIGKSALPYVNPQTGDFWYEYVDRALTPEEENQIMIDQLQSQQDALTLEVLQLKGLM